MSAVEILNAAAGHIGQRAASRDQPDGERSMRRTVQAFNALTGALLTERQGWHHRQLVDWAHTHQDMREAYGPSLMDGSRKFREVFGSDDELLERQNRYLEENQ